MVRMMLPVVVTWLKVMVVDVPSPRERVTCTPEPGGGGEEWIGSRL